MNQNRFPGHNLCCIENTAFLGAADEVIGIAVALSVLDNHVVR
jgi:hypothetical protein